MNSFKQSVGAMVLSAIFSLNVSGEVRADDCSEFVLDSVGKVLLKSSSVIGAAPYPHDRRLSYFVLVRPPSSALGAYDDVIDISISADISHALAPSCSKRVDILNKKPFLSCFLSAQKSKLTVGVRFKLTDNITTDIAKYEEITKLITKYVLEDIICDISDL
jgi:hypothetical protein